MTRTSEQQNQLHLLECGDEFFPALIKQIEGASVEIFIETYIYSQDDMGGQIAQALENAQKRGVEVHVIFDWVGSGIQESEELKSWFERRNIACRIFNPWFRRGFARTHRKLAVIDQRVAFIGGINIINDWFDDSDPTLQLAAPRWDLAIQVQGPVVFAIHRELLAQWRKTGKLRWRKRFEILQDLRKKSRLDMGASHFWAHAQLVVRDNLRNRSAIQRSMLNAISKAQSEILLVTPYFAPGRKLKVALIAAAHRGVTVKLLLGTGQFAWQDAVAQAYYANLLQHGIQIFEYRKTQLHAKVLLVDASKLNIGSSNLDGLSLFVNHEANILVESAQFGHEVKSRIVRVLAESVQIHTQAFKQLSIFKRASNGAAYLLYRLVMRVLSYGRYG